jgi:hypothetical protein
MPNHELRHELRRNADNEPVCACGYRPDVLDDWRSTAVITRVLKARDMVLDHARAANEATEAIAADNVVRFVEEVLGQELQPWQARMLQRVSDAPFVVTDETRFPRAGVRPLASGEWKLTLWDEPDVVHAWTDEACAIHPTMYTAIVTGEMIIGAHRQSGTRLNGMSA